MHFYSCLPQHKQRHNKRQPETALQTLVFYVSHYIPYWLMLNNSVLFAISQNSNVMSLKVSVTYYPSLKHATRIHRLCLKHSCTVPNNHMKTCTGTSVQSLALPTGKNGKKQLVFNSYNYTLYRSIKTKHM